MLPKIASSDSLTTVAGSHLRGFRGVAGESRLRPRIVAEDCTTRYFLKCRTDGYVEEVKVFNPVGEIICFTMADNGDQLLWGCRDIGDDTIVFYPHPGYVHTRVCGECKGVSTFGVKCLHCEDSGAIPRQVCLVTEKHVLAERIYLEPTRKFFFSEKT